MAITDPERLEKAFEQAKASAEIEGFIVTEEDEKIVKSVVSGEMTIEELIDLHKKKS
jgi:Antitoxin VbhA